MHLSDLLELSLLTTNHVAGRRRIAPDESIMRRYWTASRRRLNRWSEDLNRFQQLEQATPKGAARKPSEAFLRLLEEVLGADVLTRVWAAAAVDADRDQPELAAGSIARNALAASQEARSRAMSAVLRSKQLSHLQADGLNRLRRRCERWTDLMLARASLATGIELAVELGYDADRVRDFANQYAGSGALRDGAWRLSAGSMQRGFRTGWSPAASNEDLNLEVAAAVLASLEAEENKPLPLPGALWQARMFNAAEYINDLLQSLEPSVLI